MGAIYRIWNEANGKSYVGQSSRPYRRVLRHLMPGEHGGSKEIQKDLLKYYPDVWNWRIVADEKDYPGVTLDELETEFIKKWDSYENGYNNAPGGGVGASKSTHTEQYLSIKGKLFAISEMREGIKDAIADYQFEASHGMSRTEYSWRKTIISQYGSLEAYDQHMKAERERKERESQQFARRCFWWVVVLLVLIFLVGRC